MSDFSKHSLGKGASILQGETERSVRKLRKSFEELDALGVAYVPADAADWVDPPPTTVAEALDRLAAAGGTTPVP